MKKNYKLARRYAKALLLIGQEDGQTETYREELNNFVGLLEREKGLEAAISNPIYDSSARRKVLDQVLTKLELSRVMQSFLLLLFEKGRILSAGAINEVFQKLADEAKGIARAEVVAATDLDQDTVDKIRSGLSRMTGKEVLVEVEKDPSLIGGVVTRIGDLVLDGSIKTQLLNLKESLKRSEAV
ncbi:MAG: ATP synthase F1 subunit delta [Desulfatibacillaceae bacterium]